MSAGRLFSFGLRANGGSSEPDPGIEAGERPTGPRERRSGLVAGIVIALLGLVVSLAAVFTSARSSVQVAELGTRGIYDEAVLSAAATTRNRAVQVFLIESAVGAGVADRSEVTSAVEVTQAGIVELRDRVERLAQRLDDSSAQSALLESSDEFIAGVESLLAGLLQGGGISEQELESMDARYRDLAGFLADDRDLVVRDLELAQEEAGRIADATRFLVAFAIPLGAVVAFRRSIRRRQRQVELEQELVRQREIAQTKDDFIADVSHELRTPLTSIYGFASTLLDREIADDPELTTEFATLIAMEADELSRMVDDLLTAARADDDALSFRREKVDPQAEVEAVVAPMRAVGVDILTKIDPHPINGDRIRLRQVLRNLLSNAQKHGRPPIAVTGRVERLRYVLAITDCGPGVPDELEGRLFQRFVHRGRDPLLTGSVGLGLSIARLLTRRMGGNLFYLRQGNLTTFVVELPLWVDLSDGITQELKPELSTDTIDSP
jgi:signal transduction histidine kinase